MAHLVNMKDVMWFLGAGQTRAELGRFQMEFMSLVHVPYHNRWIYFRPWEYWTVLRHLQIESDDAVLDTGSLRAYTPVWMARCAKEVVCIDNGYWAKIARGPDLHSFDEWTQSMQEYGQTNIKTVLNDMRQMPFHSNHFDLVVSWSVLEHIVEDDQASKEIHRVLKPGGIFAGTVDFGCSEESKPNNRLYDTVTFHKRIVVPAGWQYVARAPTKFAASGIRSAMAFFLEKQ